MMGVNLFQQFATKRYWELLLLQFHFYCAYPVLNPPTLDLSLGGLSIILNEREKAKVLLSRPI